MSVICIIPARGGSKRIPRKNVALFHGRPIISWSIKAAFDSDLFDRIVVSTNDQEIAEVARAEGADVPFLRPDALADDFTPTVPVISHAIEALALEPDAAVCCLYATAPLVRADDIRAGYLLLEDADTVISITSFAFPIQRGLRFLKNGNVEMLHPEHLLTRSQDLEETWHDAGQFYWARANFWSRGGSLFGSGAKGLPLPRFRVQDIDTLEDWARAEVLFASVQD
jgi:pseudaminic acid cytidylyltransferase